MTTEIDILNTSWETFQRVLNHEHHQQIYLPTRHTANPENCNNNNINNRLPSFQELFSHDYSKSSPSPSNNCYSPSSPSSLSNSDSSEDSDSSTFFESFFSLENLNTIKIESQQMQDEIQFQHPEQPRQIKHIIKREKDLVFHKPKTIEIKLKVNKIKHAIHEIPGNDEKNTLCNNNNNNNNKNLKSCVLSKKNVTKVSSPTSSAKKVETVRTIWYNNLQQIITHTMIPNKRCLYKFANPSNCPWDSKDGLYIFEIHLLQVLCPKEAWNFKRYVDNHSKKTGEGQTFTLCSSIHKDEWEFLDMKSNKFFKKARMININAFKEKNGFITKGKWKYIYSIFQKEFEDCIINTFTVNTN